MATFSMTKDAEAVLDYGINWESWLGVDTIVTSTWSVSGPDADLVIDSESESATVTALWLSGGTTGAKYIVTNHIVTAAGREDDRSISVSIQDR